MLGVELFYGVEVAAKQAKVHVVVSKGLLLFGLYKAGYQELFHVLGHSGLGVAELRHKVLVAYLAACDVFCIDIAEKLHPKRVSQRV